MRLRLKTTVVSLLIAAGLLALLYGVGRIVLMRDYLRLEREMMLQDGRQFEQYFERCVDEIETMCRDWSIWDDTYRFVQEPYELYVEQNLLGDALEWLEIDGIAIINLEGEIVGGVARDRTMQTASDVPPWLPSAAADEDPTILRSGESGGITGLYMTPGGPVILSAQPIFPSDQQGRSRGTIVFYRVVDDTLTEAMTTLSDVRAHFHTRPDEVADKLGRDPDRAPTFAQPLIEYADKRWHVLYAALPDVNGDPCLPVRLEAPRTIYLQGRASLRSFMLAATALSLVFVLATALLFDRLVARRLDGVRRTVQRIIRSGDLSIRMQVESTDEIAELSRDVNVMVEDLEQSKVVLTHARDAAERLMAAKSDFLANMSHEIRTPMTAILGHIELIADGEIPPAQRDDHVQTIRRNGEHLLALINNILDLSKIDATRLNVRQVPCSVADVVRDVVQLMEVTSGAKGLPLTVEYTTAIPKTIRTDPTRLRQILLNLVGNAIKFTDHGHVAVRVSCHPVGQCGVILFRVEDTGIGMSAAQQHQIFEPFYQADSSMSRSYGGTGLGLAISSRFAELLGGGIDVRSTEGRGSTFSLRIETGLLLGIPMLEPDELHASVPSRRPNDAPKPCEGRILLAEDGVDNQRLIRFMLKRGGYEVDLAENGRTALEKVSAAQSGGTPYDLVLMDMQMPIMDGYEATRELRRSGLSTPIVALTAHAMADDRSKCLAAGCDDYASKPVKREQLLELVRLHIERHRVKRSSPGASRAA
jgi:signal transduction histidine kinase/CheY-like chemotaxis protein